MANCKVCGQSVLFSESDFEATANCSCQNFVVITSSGEEMVVRGSNEKAAALSYAKQHLEDNTIEKIKVGDLFFNVCSEVEINYFASEE